MLTLVGGLENWLRVSRVVLVPLRASLHQDSSVYCQTHCCRRCPYSLTAQVSPGDTLKVTSPDGFDVQASDSQRRLVPELLARLGVVTMITSLIASFV